MTTKVDDHAGDHAPVASGGTRLSGGIVLGQVIIVLLIFDALLTLALEVLYLPTYLGSLAFPVSVVAAGVVNVLLVAGVRTVTRRPAVMGLPVVAWAFGFLVCASRGPGGDILLGSDWRTALLLFGGLLPPLGYIYIQANAHVFSRH
ncbi:hypothetical protein LTT66_19015 [Nocardia gipuzkoensis]|uniref:hypothetical protein n=1 Tax=Nocardia gipuzkoensis TaxID=2749991 RepID=UPI001E3E1B1F|nr:hypothetical protein [Nocardia gipuzkoensis]UGT65450.1 hypothetical protein LTT66_19015 [Nocardia gipuzkoensis]